MAADYTLIVGAKRNPAVDFSLLLGEDEILVEVESETEEDVRPLITVTPDDTGLVISDISIIETTEEIGGKSVEPNKAIQFRATAVTAGEYTIEIKVKTNSVPYQEPITRVLMDVID
ncbi:hypothetical protein [Gimesia maris]|uniref:hypothetical protein n=1 Tax=Gimesia maris TaxID=122 RepID=UPI0032EFC384